jgi:hypothetical protein
LQVYSNYNEALAHPSGNNFNEIIGIVNYKYKRAFTQIKMNQLTYNAEAEFPNGLIAHKITNFQAHLGFLINPKNNLSLLVGINQRNEKIESNWRASSSINKTNYIYFGIRTSLRNLYNDF